MMAQICLALGCLALGSFVTSVAVERDESVWEGTITFAVCFGIALILWAGIAIEKSAPRDRKKQQMTNDDFNPELVGTVNLLDKIVAGYMLPEGFDSWALKTVAETGAEFGVTA